MEFTVRSSGEVSVGRLHVLRGVYLLTAAYLGARVWPSIAAGPQLAEPLPGVAVSLYAGLSLLCLAGVRYPLAMLPLLFLQLTYKIVWLLWVGLPEGFRGAAAELSIPFAAVALGDLIVIPWPHVVARFVRTRGDRWTSRAPATRVMTD